MPHNPNICPTPEQLLELYPVFAAPPFASGFNAWAVDVVGTGAGAYIIDVAGTPYVYPSDGTEADATALRDAILGVLTATPAVDWIATATGATGITINSIKDGLSLAVKSNLGPTGSELTLDETVALIPGDLIHQALQFADCLVCNWGCSTWAACTAAAVHWLKMWNQGQATIGGPSGPVASMTQGPFSVSFAQAQMSSGSDGWWGSTPEGTQFLFLRKQQGPVAFNLRGGMACHPAFPGRTRSGRSWL